MMKENKTNLVEKDASTGKVARVSKEIEVILKKENCTLISGMRPTMIGDLMVKQESAVIVFDLDEVKKGNEKAAEKTDEKADEKTGAK